MITIRVARPGEGPRVRELRMRAIADAPEAFAATLKEESERPDEHWARLAAGDDDAAAFLAVDGERLIGTAAVRWFDRDAGIAHLWGLWVEPAARRAGTGTLLVGAVRDWAADRGARRLRLGVVEGAGDAARFYERLGFERTGETRPMLREPAREAFFLVRPV